MKVKDLYKKYKDYNIQLFGKPLDRETIPFSFLPFDRKELMNMEVMDIKVEEKPFDSPRFGFPDLKFKGNDHYKGHVLAYCVKPEKVESLTASLNKNLKEFDSMSVEDELAYLKELAGNKSLHLDENIKYENGKLHFKTKTGWSDENDRPVRNAGDYKIFARHFDCALPYTHYYIANVNNGRVFVIPEVVTVWTFGVLKDLTENLKAGYDVEKRKMEEKYKNIDFDPFEGL